MQEVKKGNWWQRKTPGQKVSFIVGAIIFAISLAGFIVFMDARKLFGNEVGDRVFGEGVANGWVLFGKALIEGSTKWLFS